MAGEKKIRVPLWIYPSTERKIDMHYMEDNCKSPSEFIKRVVLFYIGYLSQAENVNYISPMITETVKATIKGTEQRLARLLFKVAVELGKLSHMLVAANEPMSEAIEAYEDKQNERIGFATVSDALLTGNIVQFICDISQYPENHSLLFGIIFMLFGFLFISLGMYVYMKAEHGCGTKVGLLIAIGKHLPKIPLGIVEILLWATVTFFGWIPGGTVGIGTVISTFGAGAVMHLFYSVIRFEPRKLKHKSLTETVKLLSGK